MFVTHVPKTIFNDLPLPDNCYTFGFSTARELGVKIVNNLSSDAKCLGRWYIIVVIGARTGHLSLDIGKKHLFPFLSPPHFRKRKESALFPFFSSRNAQAKQRQRLSLSSRNNSIIKNLITMNYGSIINTSVGNRKGLMKNREDRGGEGIEKNRLYIPMPWGLQRELTPKEVTKR